MTGIACTRYWNVQKLRLICFLTLTSSDILLKQDNALGPEQWNHLPLWCKPPRKVLYRRTFGTPDQGQTLDVWESQTTESAMRWRAPYRSTSYSWSCSWSYSWTHVLRIKTMTSLILDHVATDYLYLGINTERKICSWNCPGTRSW